MPKPTMFRVHARLKSDKGGYMEQISTDCTIMDALVMIRESLERGMQVNAYPEANQSHGDIWEALKPPNS